MFANPSLLILWGGLALVTVFPLWKGGTAERFGAAINIACAVAAWGANSVWQGDDAASALLVIDFALAIGFLLLAVRYASFWLGAAMILQGIQFSLHAFYLVAERPHDLLYHRINNLDTIGIALSLVVGAVFAIRKRGRDRRAAAAVGLAPMATRSPRPTSAPIAA